MRVPLACLTQPTSQENYFIGLILAFYLRTGNIYKFSPIPVAARSKAWVCVLSLAGIAASNTAGGVDVFGYYYLLSGRALCILPSVCQIGKP